MSPSQSPSCDAGPARSAAPRRRVASPRKRRLAVKASSVAMGQFRTLLPTTSAHMGTWCMLNNELPKGVCRNRRGELAVRVPSAGIFMFAVAICFAFSAFAQGLPKASKPEELGFSSERLKRLAPAFQADVDKGTIPGAVVLVARNGKVAYLEAFGFQNREK